MPTTTVVADDVAAAPHLADAAIHLSIDVPTWWRDAPENMDEE